MAEERSPAETALRDEAFLSQLNRYGQLALSPEGGSMYPMLHGAGDAVVLARPTAALRRLDVALYRNDHGEYVLHRVLCFEPEGVVFCGDGRLTADPPVAPGRVLAVMTEFRRNGRVIRAQSLPYRAYARLWCLSLRLRRWLLRACYGANALKKRLRGEKKRA